MTDKLQEARRDEVLFAFHRECAVPTAAQIAEWAERYPDFSEEIRAHASIRRDWAADQTEEVTDELLLARGRSRALNALYNAQVAAQSARTGAEGASFDELMSASGLGIREIAREIDIERTILADLVAGRMLPPVGPRLVQAMGQLVHASVDIFNRAVDVALAKPRLGMAKADQQPTINARPYTDIIRDSSMSDERKEYWLGED
jgi:hypothetical protein